MYSKEPIWLFPEDIFRKYQRYCSKRNITERFITRLFDAHLLWGKFNRKLRKVEILEESWLDLVVHMNYNTFLSIMPVNNEPVKISIPAYCLNSNVSTASYNVNVCEWYTSSEILKKYKQLQYEKTFTSEFLGELTMKGIIRGRYDTTDKCHYLLLNSFKELICYRNYTMQQNFLNFSDSAQ